MKRIGSAFLAAASIPLALGVGTAMGSTRPHYGGTLRVELRERVTSLDPRKWPADSIVATATEKIAALVFDRLVVLDDNGRPQPQLAVLWEHDSELKQWKFTLRRDVKFHDGTPLTPKEVAAALAPLFSDGRQILANGSSVTIQSATPMPNLLEELASGRMFVYHAQSDGTLSGTGPFRLTSWPAPQADTSGALRATFSANEDAWSGRPFVDSIEVAMGVPGTRQFMDLQLGKADIVMLAPDQVRRAPQAGLRTWSSAPVELLALVFHNQPAAPDARLRQALALSIDRTTIVNVLLQKQGEPAGGLLPQWLSGYAFLFSTAADVTRAKQLRAELGAAAPPLRLRIEGNDETARLVAERVAVNARQAGISLQVSAASDSGAVPAPQPIVVLRMVRSRLATVAPRKELLVKAASFGLSDDSAAAVKKITGNDAEQTYAAERMLMENGQVIPLVYLPETVGLGPAVRDWMPRRWGTWRLEDVWLDRPDASASGASPRAASGARP